MTLLEKIFSVLRNKYLIAFTVFIILILFYDRNDIFVQINREKELSNLKKSQHFYEKEIEKLKKQLTEIEKDSMSLQKYARENLFMQKNNEDVFIIEPIEDSTGSKK